MVARYYDLEYNPSTRGRVYSEDGKPPKNAIQDPKTGEYICNEFDEYLVYVKATLEIVLEGEDGNLYYFDIMPDIKSRISKFRATEKRRAEMEEFFEKWQDYRIDENDDYKPVGLYHAISAYIMECC